MLQIELVYPVYTTVAIFAPYTFTCSMFVVQLYTESIAKYIPWYKSDIQLGVCVKVWYSPQAFGPTLLCNLYLYFKWFTLSLSRTHTEYNKYRASLLHAHLPASQARWTPDVRFAGLEEKDLPIFIGIHPVRKLTLY